MSKIIKADLQLSNWRRSMKLHVLHKRLCYEFYKTFKINNGYVQNNKSIYLEYSLSNSALSHTNQKRTNVILHQLDCEPLQSKLLNKLDYLRNFKLSRNRFSNFSRKYFPQNFQLYAVYYLPRRTFQCRNYLSSGVRFNLFEFSGLTMFTQIMTCFRDIKLNKGIRAQVPPLHYLLSV